MKREDEKGDPCFPPSCVIPMIRAKMKDMACYILGQEKEARPHDLGQDSELSQGVECTRPPWTSLPAHRARGTVCLWSPDILASESQVCKGIPRLQVSRPEFISQLCLPSRSRKTRDTEVTSLMVRLPWCKTAVTTSNVQNRPKDKMQRRERVSGGASGH